MIILLVAIVTLVRASSFSKLDPAQRFLMEAEQSNGKINKL